MSKHDNATQRHKTAAALFDEWACKSTTVIAGTSFRCILRDGHSGRHYSGGVNSGIEWDSEPILSRKGSGE